MGYRDTEKCKLFKRIADSVLESATLDRFELRKGDIEYGKQHELGYERIYHTSISHNQIQKVLEIKWGLTKRFNLIEDFSINHPNLLNNRNTQSTCTIDAIEVMPELLENNYDGGQLLFSDDDFGTVHFTSVSEDIVHDRLLPYADKFNNVHFLNEYFNSSTNEKKYSKLRGEWKEIYQKIIISKLAGGKYYDYLIKNLHKTIYEYKEQKEIDNINKYQQEVLDIYPLFMKEIEKLEPLENPDLFSEDNLKYLR